jgi:hypothetical protein
MGYSQGEWRYDELPRCPVCDDVIGVYEPLMHVGGGFATRSSRGEEPEICSNGQCFHLACYKRVVGEA